MRRAAPLLLLLALPGCAFFSKAKNTFEGLTNPLVGLGFVVSIQPADSSGNMDLSNTQMQDGTVFTGMLADAAKVTDLNNLPVTGADVTCDGATATDLGEGLYGIEPGTLAYQAGATWDVEVRIGNGTAAASLLLPQPSSWTPACGAGSSGSLCTWTTGADMTVDLTGEAYDSVLVMVMDVNSGDVTWSNEPTDARGVYDFTHRSDASLVVTIPGADAFPADSVYAVGVAGMIHTGASDLVEMNTALSTWMAGKMLVYPVSTLPVAR
jgi:hypothetical protein